MMEQYISLRDLDQASRKAMMAAFERKTYPAHLWTVRPDGTLRPSVAEPVWSTNDLIRPSMVIHHGKPLAMPWSVVVYGTLFLVGLGVLQAFWKMPASAWTVGSP